MTPKLFSELGLSPELLKAIDKLGFEQASPIQAASIPVLLAGKDIVGQSQTGSGKTAAFGVPAVQIVDVTKRAVQVLILCPTRELAMQVSEEIHKLAFFKRGIIALPIYGGQSYDRQLFGLKQGAQIVIGTPGRVMDHMRRGTLRLENLKMVILDEADVMLNMGFRDDIETILKDAPKTRQTVFFSATMPRPIRDLIEKYANAPENIKIEQKAMTVPTVDQVYFEVDRRYKIELLTRLIDIYDLKLGIIFCNTKRMVDDLVDHLEGLGYQADRLHGDMTQAQRDRVMNKFRKSGLEFLVATDVAARGIDVDDVQVVFNFDLPYDVEDYVHRIGRTGRAGKSGRAISLVPFRELFQIRNIERFTNVRIQRGKVPTENEVAEAKEGVFLDKLRALLTSGEFQKQDHLIDKLLEESFSTNDIASALIHLLQHGEAAKSAPKVESYDRPERDERPPARSDDRRERYEDRAPRGANFRDRAPQRDDRRPSFDQRRDERPRPGAPAFAPARSRDAVPPAKQKVSPWKAAPAAAPAPVAKVVTPPAETKPAAIEPKAEPVKTYSDAEILASVKAPEPKPASKLFIKAKPEAEAAPKPKPSRATPEGQTRLWISLGAEQGVAPIDFVNSVAGETGLPGKVVGTVDVRERHSFVDVAAEHANGIVAKLNRAEIKGQKVKVKLA
ncbi:MAG: DEAD-box ATP-dependent helicase CshA [Verrucomicrobiota bacterium]